MSIINVLRCDSLQESKNEFRNVIQKAVDSHKGPTFTVGLSGGSLVTILAEILPTIQTNWKKWKFFFCDERLVSFDDPESTFGAYRSKLAPLIPELSLNQFVTIDPGLKSWPVAYDYLAKVKQTFDPTGSSDVDFPSFDLLFLGMGPDGHTCSLFPDHPLLSVSGSWIFFLLPICITTNNICLQQENKLWISYIGDSPKVTMLYLQFKHTHQFNGLILATTGTNHHDITSSKRGQMLRVLRYGSLESRDYQSTFQSLFTPPRH